ncbi:DUF397 domain-containing protein [Streptomyces sp. NPDC059740]|uniref:DUF397 domain-containing protein n=1 Tax=Streptomyces sp. NPDC059740 TaxID=3346926 RepID=UPI00364E31F3
MSDLSTGYIAERWRKSSYSNAENGNCLEVTDAPGSVPVRDSKQPAGTVLVFPASAWAAFVADVRRSGAREG